MINTISDYKKKEKIVLSLNKQMVDFRQREFIRVQHENKEKWEACKEHEYEYTNTKWQSISQRRCINCGHTIE